MNYKRIYYTITTNAVDRKIESYTERHHIVPKSLGGSNDVSNLVNLTAREHFICHWLLTKMHTGKDHHKMLNALRMMRAEKKGQMRYNTKITSRVYENLKIEYSELQSKRFSGEGNGFYNHSHTPEAIQKIKDANTGRIQPTAEKERQIAAQTGRTRAPFSNEWKANLSNNHKSKQPSFDGTLSELTKKKIGDKLRGSTRDPAVVALVAEKLKGKKRKKKLCPHCNKEIAVNTYPRWHGDNCKQKN